MRFNAMRRYPPMLVTRLLRVLPPLVLVGGAAFAQSGEGPKSSTLPSTPAQKPAEDTQAIKERVADWLKTCMADWDQATHMTKNEWRATCRRVAAERGKFLLDNPTVEALSKRDSKLRQR